MVNKAEELSLKVSEEFKSYDFNRAGAWTRKVKDAVRYSEMFNLEGRCPFYGWLACLTKILQPGKVVEIGADRGTSADFFLSEMPETGKLLSFDKRVGWEYTPNWDNRLIKLVGDDLDILRNIGKSIMDTDVWFIDSDHQPPHVAEVMKEVLKLAQSGPVIINHDVSEFGLIDIIKSYPCDYWQDDREIFENGISLQIV